MGIGGIGAEFGQRLFELFGRKRLAVPAVFIGQEADAVAFFGAGDDREGTAARGARLIERGDDGGHVVAVHDLGGPALRLEFALVDARIVAIHGALALPQGIDVGDRDQIVDRVVPGELSRLPDLAFRHFAVAHQHVNARGRFLNARAHRQAGADRKPLAQRAGGRVHAGNARRRMAFEFARKLPQRHQARNRKDSGLSQRGVENRRGMSLGEHEAIARERVGIRGIEFHGMEKRRGHQFGGGKARGGMARARGRGHAQGMNAQDASLFAKRFERCQGGSSLSGCGHVTPPTRAACERESADGAAIVPNRPRRREATFFLGLCAGGRPAGCDVFSLAHDST